MRCIFFEYKSISTATRYWYPHNLFEFSSCHGVPYKSNQIMVDILIPISVEWMPWVPMALVVCSNVRVSAKSSVEPALVEDALLRRKAN